MKERFFEVVADDFRKNKDVKITAPTRGSKSSAGYDFYSPIDITIEPGGRTVVWSDIKAYMQPDEVLKMYVRSSIGIKKGLVLPNGTGIIDSDYYGNPKNDGNIGLALWNTTDKTVHIEAGERICQGIFTKYLKVTDDTADTVRTGGIGSTNG